MRTAYIAVPVNIEWAILGPPHKRVRHGSEKNVFILMTGKELINVFKMLPNLAKNIKKNFELLIVIKKLNGQFQMVKSGEMKQVIHLGLVRERGDVPKHHLVKK